MAPIEEWKITASELQDRAKVFDTYATHQPKFDSAKTNIAKELDSVAGALCDVSKSKATQVKPNEAKTENAQNMTNDALKVATASVVAMQDALSDNISIDDLSAAAKNADNGYDAAFKVIKEFNPIAVDAFVESYEKNHPIIFEAGSQIKNNSSDILLAASAIGSWGGDYGTPEQAMNKINTNVQNIANGTAALALSLKSITDTIYSSLGKQPDWINHYIKDGTNICTNLGGAAAGLTMAGVTGIGSFNSARNAMDALKHGNIASASGHISSAVGGLLKTGASIVTAAVSIRQFGETWKHDHEKTPKLDGKGTGGAAAIEESILESTLEPQFTTEYTSRSTKLVVEESKETTSAQTSSSSTEEDFSADMIGEINVVLDGTSSSHNSCCSINGEKYKLSNYSLSQELLQPMILNFSIEKENKIETQSDVVFADTTQLIGKSFEINVSTIKTSHEDSNAKPQKAFVFKGMIIDVSASRATASTQSASITVATWDALLQNAPHCRSFENMTLKDIIESVLKPYSDIKSKISPRFKDKIPYIVQYNQSDYAFISMLAVRFGEWMYNTGETFIFGEIEDPGSSANLEYPGGSLMSYNLHQSMTSFSFNHLLPDYYQYGKEKAILKESAQGVADGTVNNWTDKAYNASIQRFKNEQIAALNAGGFDSGKEDEGSDSILDYSLKIEAQGKKTGIMTVHGFSKLAMLKIGQTFLIRDNVQNKSGESKDVEQKALKVIGINHSFDYRQEYSNSFTAVPVACSYPSYSDADVFPSAPQQRAKVVENKDEQKLGRIRVQFPWQEIQSKDMKTPWLRIAVPYAGASKGHQFVPEIGEEVMVGFEMNNAERPYIIGSFYNGGNGKPDVDWAVSKEEDGTTNNIKAIRTRNGHTILFNDKGEAGLLEIYDNKNNIYHITLSADDKKITIYSAGEIEVIADTDINIRAKGDIGINADGDIGIKSKGNISMEAKKEVSIQASKVKVR